MSEALDEKKIRYKNLKKEIKELDEKADYLKSNLKNKEKELDEIKELLMIKDMEIEALCKDSGGVKPPDFTDPAAKKRRMNRT
jgi:hypothetical protein